MIRHANKIITMECKNVNDETKNTDTSFPLIIGSHRDKQHSEKSLFKNDSESSEQMPPAAMPVAAVPPIDQIKKFLKMGDSLNSNTLRKLKEDPQIQEMAKNDKSSASLYRTSRRYLHFGGVETPKQQQIRRIYMAGKQKTKPMLKMGTFRNSRLSQEVQTQLAGPQIVGDSRTDLTMEQAAYLGYPSFQNQISYKSIEAIQEEPSTRQRRGNKVTSPLELTADQEENNLLPRKERKGIGYAQGRTGRAKVDSYIHTMAKTEFNFHRNISRYGPNQQYPEQKTIYNRTIDVQPLRPHQTLFQQTSPEQTSPSLPSPPPQKMLTSQILAQPVKESSVKQEPSPMKPQSIMPQSQKAPSVKPVVDVMPRNTQQSISFMGDLPPIEKEISMIAEQTENQSPENSERHNPEYPSRFSQNMIGLVPISSFRKHPQVEEKQPQSAQFTKKKQSISIQVPSVFELQIGGQQGGPQKSRHPIKQTMGISQLEWIKQQYHPKHQLLRGMDMDNISIKKYKNGAYFGQLDAQGRKQGKGIIFYFSGKIYEGQVAHDMKNGKGMESYPDGGTYQGDFRSGMKHGKGVYEWPNGEIYDGQWEKGRKNGSGMWKGIDGDSYMGEWKNGKVEGFGVYLMKNGSRYEGQFRNSVKHGVGTQRFENGETYVGSYEKNRPNGQGEYYWANGDYYKGTFSNGLRHGEGYFRESKTNVEYQGQYRNDKKCGYGQISYQDGLVYVGNFENGLRHGYGELTQDGKTILYKGYWINDQQVSQPKEQETPPKPKKKKITTFKPIIEEQPQPKALPRVLNQPKQPVKREARSTARTIPVANRSQPTRQNKSLSPEGEDPGFMRACGCNRHH